MRASELPANGAVLVQDDHGECRVWFVDVTPAQARALLWEALKDLTPGVRA